MGVNQRQKPCSVETIDRFLSDRLSAADLAAFEDHLDLCANCRRELEVRAGDESWWIAARDCLAPSGGSPEILASADGSGAIDVVQSTELPGEGPSLLTAVKLFLNPTDDPRMLGRVGNYEIAGIIGSGGNGVVLKGFDAALSRNVAIKMLSPRLADSGAARHRFSREAQAAAAVVHENVMAIHAVAETKGLPYLVMPYVRGPSLETRLRNRGPLALEEVLRVGRQVAAGLAAAHAQGLVHRDIKPANILLEEGVERVKITDFGLARAIDDASLTRSGVIAGTPQYMSPEQARGESIDHRADLFSLGCVLYAACAGRSPFRARSSYGVLRKICESEPPDLRELNPATPLWLVRVIQRLLAKEPSQRFDSAADVAALLERCLAHVRQPTTIALPEELTANDRRRWPISAAMVWVRRHRLAAGVTSIIVTGILAGLAMRSPPAPEPQSGNSQRAAAAIGDDLPSGDQIDDAISRVSAKARRLQSEVTDDLWNDSLDARIEQLKSDVTDLKARMSESNSSTSTQETKP